MDGIPVYAGDLPEAVAMEFKFNDVYQVKVSKKDKTVFTRAEYDTSEKVEQLYDNMRASALEAAIKRFATSSDVVPRHTSTLLANVRIVSEKQIEWFDGDLEVEEDRPSPKLEILVEAIGYKRV